MQSLKNSLTHSTFRVPDFSPEQWAEMNAASERFEEERRKRQKLERIQRAAIPSDYRSAEPMRVVADWVSNPSKGLLLQGQVGRGKTHNACGALLMAIDQGKTARFTTFDDLLRECKATFSNLETEEQVIGRYANVGFLCIDDMGKERVTEWSLPIIFAIINKRGMQRKPTIITTQYAGRQLVERMTVNGDSETARAIVSRMMEYDRVTVEGQDWRRK